MANGYNPYNVVGTQQGLLENLLGAQQTQRQGQFDIGQHKGEMGEEFQKEQIASQKEQERILNRQRKGSFLEKLAPMLGLIPGVGTIAGGVLGGLSGMHGLRKGSKFAKRRIEEARGAGLSDKWGGTFLGSQARDITGKTETMLDKMKSEVDVSGMDLLTKGLFEGIKGFAMGKMGEGIGEGIKGVTENRELLEGLEGIEGVDIDKIGGLEDLDKLTDDQFAKLAKITGEGDTEKLFELISGKDGLQALKTSGGGSYLDAIFGAGGLGQAPSTLLQGGGKGQNVLQNLLLMLQMGGGR